MAIRLNKWKTGTRRYVMPKQLFVDSHWLVRLADLVQFDTLNTDIDQWTVEWSVYLRMLYKKGCIVFNIVFDFLICN